MVTVKQYKRISLNILIICLKDCPSSQHKSCVCILSSYYGFSQEHLCIWTCMLLIHKIIYILVLWVMWVDQFFFCFQNYSPYFAFTLSELFILYLFSRGSIATPLSPASLSAEWSLCNMFWFEDFRWTLYFPYIYIYIYI